MHYWTEQMIVACGQLLLHMPRGTLFFIRQPVAETTDRG